MAHKVGTTVITIRTSPRFRGTSKWFVAPIVFGLLLPALWAGRNTDGTMVGGIELAQVRVGTEGEPGFSAA